MLAEGARVQFLNIELVCSEQLSGVHHSPREVQHHSQLKVSTNLDFWLHILSTFTMYPC